MARVETPRGQGNLQYIADSAPAHDAPRATIEQPIVIAEGSESNATEDIPPQVNSEESSTNIADSAPAHDAPRATIEQPIVIAEGSESNATEDIPPQVNSEESSTT